MRVNILLIKEGDTWAVQCMDYDIASQGETIKSAISALEKTFIGQIILDMKNGKKPLEGISPAPLELKQNAYLATSINISI